MAEKGAWLFKSQAKGSLGEGEETAGLSHSYQSLPDWENLCKNTFVSRRRRGRELWVPREFSPPTKEPRAPKTRHRQKGAREEARDLSKATQGRAKTKSPASHLWDPPTNPTSAPAQTPDSAHPPHNLSFWLWEVRGNTKFPATWDRTPLFQPTGSDSRAILGL